MKKVTLLLKLVLSIGLLLCGGHAFSQTPLVTGVDSTSTTPQTPKIMKVDSTSTTPQIYEITAVDSTLTTTQTPEAEVIDSTATSESRLKFGCGFALNFVGGTNIGLSPNLVYMISDKVSIGGGIQGTYTSIKDLQKTSTIGANLMGQYSPGKFLTLLEITQLNVTTKTETDMGQTSDNYWDTALFVGAGLHITDKISIGAKYNLLYKEDESVYTSPIIPFVNITF
jgi:hypothetical protein